MKKREVTCLACILLAVLLINVYYVSLKSGYYVDEGMTLFLANGHYNGAVTSKSEYDIGDFITSYVIKPGDNLIDIFDNVCGMLQELVSAGNYSQEGTVEWYDNARKMLQGNARWMTGKELYEEVVAENGARFQYVQVYINQALDVHPVFYYFLVHTVFSLFPDAYSDAYLFSINIIFLLLTCIVLYKMIKRFWKDERAAFLAVIIYGFSQGFASCAVYFRMYAVLTFFVICTLYLHLMIREEEELFAGKRKWLALGSVVWLGFNTHYYYILFLFPLFVLTCIRIWKKKTLRTGYIKCMLITGISSLIIWPFSLYHILFGYRGTEAVSNVFSAGIIEKMQGCMGEFGKAFFAGNVWGAFFVLITLIVMSVWIQYYKKATRIIFAEMIVPCVVYLAIVAQIAPVISDRYLMCLFPILASIIAIELLNLVRLIVRKPKYESMIGICSAVIIVAVNIFLISPNYLYQEQAGKTLELSGEKKEYDCLMIGFDHGQGFPEVLKLWKFQNVLVVGQHEMDMIEPIDNSDSKGMVIYIYEGLETEEFLDIALEKMQGKESYEEIESDIESFRAYLYQK